MAVKKNNAGAVADPPEASAAIAADAGEAGQPTQVQEAAAPAQTEEKTAEVAEERGENASAVSASSAVNPVAEEAPAEEPPDRQLAAEMVTRFLGHQGSKARDEVADLNDLEAWEVIRSAGDRFTARVQIKSVISRAYDRRREAAQKAASEQQATAERASRAQAIVERRDGLTAEAAATKVAAMKPEDVAQLLAEPKT